MIEWDESQKVYTFIFKTIWGFSFYVFFYSFYSYKSYTSSDDFHWFSLRFVNILRNREPNNQTMIKYDLGMKNPSFFFVFSCSLAFKKMNNQPTLHKCWRILCCYSKLGSKIQAAKKKPKREAKHQIAEEKGIFFSSFLSSLIFASWLTAGCSTKLKLNSIHHFNKKTNRNCLCVTVDG